MYQGVAVAKGLKANNGIVRIVIYQWRVRGMQTPFNLQEIESVLRENEINWMRRPEYFESMRSSNEYLLALPGSLHGRICICDHQTHGKGRMGKQWHASPGDNLMFSLGWALPGPLSAEVSLVVGVALVDALSKLGLEDVGLKWPNDVLHKDRKLAGVLVESRISGSRAELVIGVGLNVRQQAEDMNVVEQSWTDLMQMGLREVDRQQILTNMLIELAHRLEQLKTQGFAPIRNDWLACHVHQGVTMKYSYRGEERIGKVVGLDNTGALLFESKGQQMAVNSGEVNCLRALP